MKVRRRALAALVLVVACGTTMSGATYSASSTNPNGLFTTAADFLVRVTMNDPGPALRGTVALTATASDSGGATIASVRIQRSPAGAGTWTDVCTDAVSPYSCSLNTTAVTDGFYDFRAIATNSLGQVRQSATVASRQVDNSVPSVTMADPGAWIPASATLTSTASDNAGGSGLASVRYEYTATGGSTWTTACTGSTAPFSCTFNTTTLTNGAGYDLRAVATDVAGNSTTSATIVNRRVDRTAPAASLTAPAAVLTGTVTVAGTASDTGGSGLPSVKFQYSPAGAGAWTDICTDTTSPYSCPFATSAVTDGLYDVRLLATDGAGNATASVSTNRRIDNNAPTTTLSDPGAYIRGTVTLTASVADGNGSGATSVAFERRATGTATWASACTADTVAPYTCTITTTSLANGSWDFRAVATDGAGLTGASATVVSVVDNTLPTATMNDPGAILTGSVTLTAGATDTGSGVASVLIEVRPASGTWSPVCTDTSSPYSCALASTTLTDGLYELRATTTDRAGNATVSTAVVNRRVDNNAPTVTLADPGAWIRATETLSVTASDGTGAGITSVTVQYAPTGSSTWTTVCTDTTWPYSCSLNTTTLPNGAGYDFRATAADGAGFSTTTPLFVDRRVDNTLPTGVVMDDPGSPLTGVVTFSGTAADTWSGIAEVQFQWFNGLWWSELCTASTEPFSCDVDTDAVTDGLRSVRAVATDVAGNTTTSASITNRRFDNTDPTATMTDPGANLGATVTLGATASDGGSGVASVTIQRSAAGAGAWSDVCTDTTSPYSCSFDTTSVAEGLYDFRAVAVDGVGRTNASATVANRRVDNTDPTATLTDPGAVLSGSVAATMTADDAGGSGIASVTLQYSPAGAGTWSDACTDTVSPYACSWDTRRVSDGAYDLRALATDAAGNEGASALVTGTSIDNPAGAMDVQTANGGATPGLAEAGDTLTFTYNEPMNPASIIAGWNGSGSQTVTIRFVQNGSDDRFLVYNAANTTLLALTGTNGVTMGANYVGNGGATVSGTLVTSGASFTVTLGGAVGAATANATMIWNPSAGALSVGGQASTTTARTESGGADAEF